MSCSSPNLVRSKKYDQRSVPGVSLQPGTRLPLWSFQPVELAIHDLAISSSWSQVVHLITKPNDRFEKRTFWSRPDFLISSVFVSERHKK